MLSFTPVTTDNILSLRPYIESQAFRTCDYTLGAIFQWRAYFETRYALSAGMLVMLADYAEDGWGYTYPVGDGDMAKALSAIEEDARETGRPLVYCAVPDAGVPVLQAHYGDRCVVETRRDWADYLYVASDLIEFPGKRYHTQRNHLNRFLRDNPEHRFVPVTADTLPEAVAFLDGYEQHTPVDKVIEAEEMLRAKELLRDALFLGQKAGYLVAGDTIVALAIGETIGDTLYVHVEKARLDFPGAYQAIVSLFADYAKTPETRFINREDDSGEEGLRYSKLAYRPCELLSKHWVVVHSA